MWISRCLLLGSWIHIWSFLFILLVPLCQVDYRLPFIFQYYFDSSYYSNYLLHIDIDEMEIFIPFLLELRSFNFLKTHLVFYFFLSITFHHILVSFTGCCVFLLSLLLQSSLSWIRFLPLYFSLGYLPQWWLYSFSIYAFVPSYWWVKRYHLTDE